MKQKKTYYFFIILSLLIFQFLNIKPFKNEQILEVSQELSSVTDLNLSVNSIIKLKDQLSLQNFVIPIIAIKDNLPDNQNLDLLNKILISGLASSKIDSHATVMATIIAGNGNNGIEGKGVVEKSLIFPSDFENISPDSEVILRKNNIQVQNHSYGTTIENFYGLEAIQYDNMVYKNPEILHVFSSGNSGLRTSSKGPYKGIKGYANLTGNFKMGKNILTVGAVNQKLEVLEISSKGPAYDGRIKPEIVAYSSTGTSNSAALVTGTASLLQQEYQIMTSRKASAALIKAFLLNGADDIYNEGPDFETGFGNMNAYSSMKMLKNKNYIISSLSSNQSKEFPIIIPENITNLKIMLAWTDIPASTKDIIALKNDLDLKLTYGSQTFLPWILTNNKNLKFIQQPANKGIDKLNTIEQVTIKNPIAGNYKIVVSSGGLSSEKTFFNITYSWGLLNTFEWNYPLKNNNFPYSGEGFGFFRWKSNIASKSNGILEIRFPDTKEWKVINSKVNLKKGYYQWKPPNDIEGQAIVRMRIGDKIFTNDLFTISTPTDITCNLNCDEIVQFSWTRKKNIQFYNIYKLENDKLSFLRQEQKNVFTFNKKEFSNLKFSVEPILKNNSKLPRSKILNIDTEKEKCYFDLSFAEINKENEILIFTKLNSILNVNSIEVLSVTKNQIISNKTNINTLDHQFLDIQPNEGQNTYQLKVTTNDNKVFFSKKINITYISKNGTFAIFPNPIKKNISLNIYSNNIEGKEFILEIFNMYGIKVFNKKINTERQIIETNNLELGVYVCKISGFDINQVFKLIVI